MGNWIRRCGHLFWWGALVWAGVILWPDLSGKRGILYMPIMLPVFAGLFALFLIFIGRKISRAKPLKFTAIFAWIFGTAGMLITVTSLMYAQREAMGYAFAAFGLLLAGGGFIFKLMTTPEGKRMVEVTTETQARTGANSHGIVTRTTMIAVDENASDEDVAAAIATERDRWRRENPDWASGDIIEQEVFTASTLKVASYLWTLFFALCLLAVYAWPEFFKDTPLMWLIPLGFGGSSLGLWGWRGYQALLRRKFGTSLFHVDLKTLKLGGYCKGKIDTGVSQQHFGSVKFQLQLRCLHVYEISYQVGSGDRMDRRHKMVEDVLWETEAEHGGELNAARPLCLAVPVNFEIPLEQSASSLVRTGEGIHWELKVSADLAGVDFTSSFRLPVLSPGS